MITGRNKRRKHVLMVVEARLTPEWMPVRVLLEDVNATLPQAQEISIKAIGQLIKKLVTSGIIEKQKRKLVGRQETQYRKPVSIQIPVCPIEETGEGK